MAQSIEIAIGDLVYKISRGRLGIFLRLQKARNCVLSASEIGDTGAIADALFEYLRICLPQLDRGSFNEAPWYQIVGAFAQIGELNRIQNADGFAILAVGDPSPKSPVSWDHDERSIIVWIHLIAYAYKWSKQEIENLWPEEAIAFIQEILAEEQVRQEFEYSLSEIAYPYDKNTKRHRFKPLMRPYWMVGSRRPKLDRIHKDLLPIGVVVYPPEEKRSELVGEEKNYDRTDD